MLKLWHRSSDFYKYSSNRKPKTNCNPHMIGACCSKTALEQFQWIPYMGTSGWTFVIRTFVTRTFVTTFMGPGHLWPTSKNFKYSLIYMLYLYTQGQCTCFWAIFQTETQQGRSKFLVLGIQGHCICRKANFSTQIQFSRFGSFKAI